MVWQAPVPCYPGFRLAPRGEMALAERQVESLPQDLGIPIEGVVRAAYIVGHIDKFLDVLDAAESVHNALPCSLRRVLDKTEDMGSFNHEAMAKLAYELGKYPMSLTGTLRQMFHEIRLYVGAWVEEDGNEPEPQFYGMLEEADVRVIEEMVTFMQRLGRKSCRQLLQFLEAANDGDWGCLLLQAQGGDSEIRHRHRLSDTAKAEFDLD